MRLFVCYVPGLDRRRITSECTPYVHALLSSYPSTTIKAYPCTELLPALLTGAYPDEHGKYQVRAKADVNSSPQPRLLDRLPKEVTTTVQCLYQLLDYRFDLPGVPARRRRLLDLDARFKFTERRRTSTVLARVGGLQTFFTPLGMDRGQGTYHFTMRFGKLEKFLHSICYDDYKLAFCEIHSLDVLQLWYFDRDRRIRRFYQHIDKCLRKLHKECQHLGVTLMILADRGMERTKGTINIEARLKELALSNYEYNYFIEPPMARFWFYSKQARDRILTMLAALKNGTALSYEEMHKYNVKFHNRRYGEVFWIADAGYIIFPHDFYHPLGNVFLALTDWKQLPRILSPIQRGVHGYLPECESESGFMILARKEYEARSEEVEIIDVAPSILRLMGYKKPRSMKGQCVFSTPHQ